MTNRRDFGMTSEDLNALRDQPEWMRAVENIGMIPDHMQRSVSRWILYGDLPGDFFRAVLTNNLHLAVGHADDINGKRLESWVKFLHNYAPAECHGSDEKMRRWAKKGGLLGRKAAAEDATAADTSATLQMEFRKCLTEISFTRAGYDVREMPLAQKSKEAASASDSMMRARQIWADNPDKHASLRGVFQDVEPLAEMREIEGTP